MTDEVIKAWEADVKTLLDNAGIYMAVAGDGSCWLYSLMQAMCALVHGREVNFKDKGNAIRAWVMSTKCSPNVIKSFAHCVRM